MSISVQECSESLPRVTHSTLPNRFGLLGYCCGAQRRPPPCSSFPPATPGESGRRCFDLSLCGSGSFIRIGTEAIPLGGCVLGLPRRPFWPLLQPSRSQPWGGSACAFLQASSWRSIWRLWWRLGWATVLQSPILLSVVVGSPHIAPAVLWGPPLLASTGIVRSRLLPTGLRQRCTPRADASPTQARHNLIGGKSSALSCPGSALRPWLGGSHEPPSKTGPGVCLGEQSGSRCAKLLRDSNLHSNASPRTGLTGDVLKDTGTLRSVGKSFNLLRYVPIQNRIIAAVLGVWMGLWQLWCAVLYNDFLKTSGGLALLFLLSPLASS